MYLDELAWGVKLPPTIIEINFRFNQLKLTKYKNIALIMIHSHPVFFAALLQYKPYIYT
jgi:hypothetical protein